MPGPFEIIVIAGVVFLLFGAAALPKIARSIGKAKSEFEKGLKEGKKDSVVDEKRSDEKKIEEKKNN